MNDFTPPPAGHDDARASVGVGHNAPPQPKPLTPQQVTDWLNWQHEPLLARQAQMVAALQALLDAYPTVDDDAADQAVADNISLTNALLKALRTAHATAKEPFLTGGRTVDAWRVQQTEPLERRKVELSNRQTVFQVRREAHAVAEAAQRAEAMRKAAEAQAQTALAATDTVTRDAAFDLAEHLAAEQARAETAAQGRHGPKTRGQYGTSSLRRAWTWRVEDLSLVPREYLMIDGNKLRDAMRERRADGRPAANIPGITWRPEIKTVTR